MLLRLVVLLLLILFIRVQLGIYYALIRNTKLELFASYSNPTIKLTATI
jgi:hypothetical protein